MTTTTKAPGRFYQPELDGLRFLAFVGVFLHHKSNPDLLLPHLPHTRIVEAAVWSAHIAGAYGVQLFFLLSSYLITRLLRREVATTGQLRLKEFYLRRILRIWPLYFSFLGLVAILQWVGRAPATEGGFFAAALFFCGNWYLTFPHAVWFAVVLLWTISVEEQFYICWPLFLRKAEEKSILWLSATAIVISHLTLLWLRMQHVAIEAKISYNTFTEIQFFGLGALLALWAEKNPVAIAPSKRIGFAVQGLVLLLIAALFDVRANQLSAGLITYNVQFLLSALGVISLFRAFLGSPAAWFPNWILFLGRISFGLYIFNIFAGEVAKWLCRGRASLAVEFVLTVVLNLGCAIASWYLIEKPFLKLKSRFEVVKSRPVSA